jgi:hypothetical protein
MFAGAAVKESTKPALSLIAKYGKARYHELMLEYSDCFNSHIATALDRCTKVKNILYKDQSVSLDSQYVNVTFSKGRLKKSDIDIVEDIVLGAKIIVSGTAGAGKTMFMKWSVAEIINSVSRHGLIPLFIEMRYLGEDLEGGVIDRVLLRETSKSQNRVSIELFQAGLEAGAFVIILDAIDEVKQNSRQEAISGIRKFISDYPECPILISTRPDDTLESLPDLDVVRTMDMDEDQIVSVIDKLDYNTEVKDRLIERLRNGLFAEHQEFLSNPLLATIMLLTFDQSADIPTKITSFYKQAFEALYQRHDAAKGAYRRGHHAGLPLDEYEKIFSVFCFDSYVDSKITFGDAELLTYFRDAASYYDYVCDAELLVKDAMESICVIQREGLDNVFVHRSFQEYFAALFLTRYSGDDFADQVKNINKSNNEQNIMLMLMELGPEKLEEKWVLSQLRDLVKKLRRVRPGTKSGSSAIFSAIFNSIGIDIENGKIVSFAVTHSGPNTGRAGSLLGNIEAAYGNNTMLTRFIFDDEPIFEDFWQFVKESPYAGSLADLKSRITVRPSHEYGDDDEAGKRNIINIKESDIPWLLNSKLPKRLERVRDSVVTLHDEILKRIDHRQKSMRRMSVRNRVKS